jgi:hypothetical protein
MQRDSTPDHKGSRRRSQRHPGICRHPAQSGSSGGLLTAGSGDARRGHQNVILAPPVPRQVRHSVAAYVGASSPEDRRGAITGTADEKTSAVRRWVSMPCSTAGPASSASRDLRGDVEHGVAAVPDAEPLEPVAVRVLCHAFEEEKRVPGGYVEYPGAADAIEELEETAHLFRLLRGTRTNPLPPALDGRRPRRVQLTCAAGSKRLIGDPTEVWRGRVRAVVACPPAPRCVPSSYSYSYSYGETPAPGGVVLCWAPTRPIHRTHPPWTPNGTNRSDGSVLVT